ncbi:MAG: DUF4837 family protein [Bacteroidetes bacterium]|jgi:hypothetical protein|nr:DUF4837 family protein [Bacteroidota bacterium]
MIRGFVFCLGALLLFSACGDDFSSRMQPKKTSFGPLNQMVVVAEPNVYKEMRDTVYYMFAAPYPILPQPEPLFDLVHFSPADIAEKSARRHLRTYLILVDGSDTSSRNYRMAQKDLPEVKAESMEKEIVVKIARDKWAKKQILVYVVAKDLNTLEYALARNHEKIIQRVREFEKYPRGAQVYMNGRNKPLSRMVMDSLGVGLDFPKNAEAARVNSNVAWIRMETDKSSSSIVVTSVPYDDAAQLSKKTMIRRRNDIMERQIRSGTPGSDMVVNDRDLPVTYRNIELNGYNTYEIRGVWEMTNDFMGGPFVSYFILPDNLEYIYIVDLFVYAPGEEKREYLQEIEHIASSVEIL